MAQDHFQLYYVSVIVRLTSIPLWVSGFTEGQGPVFYSIMAHVYTYSIIKKQTTVSKNML